MSRVLPIAALLIATTMLSSGCRRGAQLDVELVVAPGVAGGSRIVVVPVAVELLDARSELFRLPVVQPQAVDLAAPGSTPLRLTLRGRVPAGRYIGLRLVLDDPVRYAQPGGAETSLAVDRTGAFAAADLELEADGRGRLIAAVDLDALLVRRPPLPDVRHFLLRLHEVVGPAAPDSTPDSPFR